MLMFDNESEESNDVFNYMECWGDLNCPYAYQEYYLNEDDSEDCFEVCHAKIGDYCPMLKRNLMQ